MPHDIDIFIEQRLNRSGYFFVSITNFAANAGMAITITPTSFAFFTLFDIQWFIDISAIAAGAVFTQVRYQFNGSNRWNYTSNSVETITHNQIQDSLFFPVNGVNNIGFFIALNANTNCNGFLIVRGIYQ